MIGGIGKINFPIAIQFIEKASRSPPRDAASKVQSQGSFLLTIPT